MTPIPPDVRRRMGSAVTRPETGRKARTETTMDEEARSMTESEIVSWWMIERGYATGHGDTVEDMLGELVWQIRESAEAQLASAQAEIERLVDRCDELAETVDVKAAHLSRDAVQRAEIAEAAWADLQSAIAVKDAAIIDTAAHLAASISLLERSPKKGAPSDKMFDQMLMDYRASLERARAAVTAPVGEGKDDG